MHLIHLAALFIHGSRAESKLYSVGVAKVNITPDFPVRLSGFGNRRLEATGVALPIYAKALVIGSDHEPPIICITVDSCGISKRITNEVVTNLHNKVGISQDRVAITASHTHSAPMLSGVLPTLFGEPIPPPHQKNVDRYTHFLIMKLIQVANAALDDQQPAHLSWAIGAVGFAVNRRTAGGPVDHDLPMLALKTPECYEEQHRYTLN